MFNPFTPRGFSKIDLNRPNAYLSVAAMSQLLERENNKDIIGIKPNHKM